MTGFFYIKFQLIEAFNLWVLVTAFTKIAQYGIGAKQHPYHCSPKKHEITNLVSLLRCAICQGSAAGFLRGFPNEEL